ncbi:MAG TPA: hypothetical protein VIV66_11430 [Pyrinomonadaceae bacterium]
MKQKLFIVGSVVLSMLSALNAVTAQQSQHGFTQRRIKGAETQRLNALQQAATASVQANASQRSYAKARRVLDDGIEAMGGLAALRGIKDFTLKEKGTVYARYQSPSPEPPFITGPSEETLVVDNERGFLFDDLKTANGGFNTWVKTVIKGSEGQTLDMWSRTSTPIPNASLNNFRGQIRRLPPFVLLEALDRASTLRWVGEDELGGKKQRVISVLRPDNQELSLYFDAQTNLLSRYELCRSDGGRLCDCPELSGVSSCRQVKTSYRTSSVQFWWTHSGSRIHGCRDQHSAGRKCI